MPQLPYKEDFYWFKNTVKYILMFSIYYFYTNIASRRGAEGGETGEIPHPRDLGWDRVGKRVGNVPTLFWV